MELYYNSYQILKLWLNILEANSVKVLYIHSQQHNYLQFQARDIAEHLYYLEIPESSVYEFDSEELEENEYIRLSDIKVKTEE